MRLRFFLSILLCLCTLSSVAQTVASQKEKKQKLEKEIKLLEENLRQNQSKTGSEMNTLNLLKKKESNRKQLIKASEKEIRQLNDSIYACQKSINLINARLDTMTFYYDRLVKNAYKNRKAGIWYMFILSSHSISQASSRYAYLKSLSVQMNNQAKKIHEARAELEDKMAEMKTLKSSAEKLKKEKSIELKKLQAEEQQSRKVIAQLQKNKKKYTRELNDKKKRVEALNKEIQKLIKAEIAKSKKNKKTMKPSDIKLSEEFSANKGKLPWPAEGPVVLGFGRNPHPVYKNISMPFNNGINVAVSKGTPVKAVFNGEVKKIIVMLGYDKCVLVQHGEYFTFYCKLESVIVKAGQKIKTGQTIGSVGVMDGQSQFHFQLWMGNEPQDPEVWLR